MCIYERVECKYYSINSNLNVASSVFVSATTAHTASAPSTPLAHVTIADRPVVERRLRGNGG